MQMGIMQSIILYPIQKNLPPFYQKQGQSKPHLHPIAHLLPSPSSTMAKIRIEVCMISARGLVRPSSIWKLQWFAVGWVDPKNKYCSKIDASGSSMPTWRTKFSVAVDEGEVDLRELAITVEVRSRETIFLRERLYGTASIPLREFMERFDREGRRSTGVEEFGSFQLRGRKSGEPRGFVDVSVRVWEEGADAYASLHTAAGEEYYPRSSGRNKTSLYMEDGPTITYPEADRESQRRPSIHRRARRPASATAHPPADAYAPATLPAEPPPYLYRRREEPENEHTRRPTPPPPPPPSNTGFLPSFFPSSYAGAPHQFGGFGVGAGAGAFAAGAVLFGDDFMSAGGFPDGGGLGSSVDPPPF